MEERKDGHSALKVQDGKLEKFDPNPKTLPFVVLERIPSIPNDDRHLDSIPLVSGVLGDEHWTLSGSGDHLVLTFRNKNFSINLAHLVPLWLKAILDTNHCPPKSSLILPK